MGTKAKLPPFGSRMRFLAQSEIRRMTKDCEERGGINMAQGLCDSEIPEPVRRAAQAAIDGGPNSYVPHNGIPQLRNVIAGELKRHRDLSYDPESEIVVTSGASAAFWAACLTLFDPGDEVVLFEPYYGYHLSHLRACGLTARFVELSPPAFGFTVEDLERQVTPRTRALVVSTPSNPCGKVFTLSELQAVAEVATRHNLWVITDEIYEHFVYDGLTHISPATLPALRDRCVTISGFSKTLAITGWRVGFCAAPAELAARLALACDLVYICAPAPLQAGIAAGLSAIPETFFPELVRTHQDKRDRFCAALERAGLPPVIPDGAYYVLADVTKLKGDSAKQRVESLLQQTGIAAVPGTAFYHQPADNHGETYARFCFGKRDEVLDEACERLTRLG